MLLANLAHRELRQAWLQLNLVHCGHDLALFDNAFDLFLAEVGHPNRADFACIHLVSYQ